MKPLRNVWRLWRAAVLLLIGLPVLAVSPPAPIQFTLANGMTLIVQADRRAPTAVHMLWVRAGAMDEEEGRSGVAHALEHLLFKGTERLAEGEFSRRVAAMGGRENAFTNRDATAYHQQIPAERLPEMMALEADRFANNRWSDEVFGREMKVIFEERRQRIEGSPTSQFFEAFNAQALSVHPYRRPVIGWPADLEALKPDDARAFYRRWYVPANAAVVVVGDVDPGQVRQWAEQHYGAIPARALPARAAPAEPEAAGPRRFDTTGRTQRPLLAIGFRVPGLAHPDADDTDSADALALSLLVAVLDGGSASRLERALVQGKGPAGTRRLADSVGASYDLMARGPHRFMLTASPVDGVSPAELESALRAEVDRVARDGVSEAELRRVKNQWAASEVFERDSLYAQAQELGSHWVQGWPLDASARVLERVRRVTPEQVQSVAARYFGERHMTVGVLRPEGAR